MIFAIAAAAAGRVWRFPFDDELMSIGRRLPPGFGDSAWDLTRYYLDGGDIHPPTAFVFFSALYGLSGNEAALRLVSLAMTAATLALWLLIALAVIDTRRGAPTDLATRVMACLLFGLSPLAIGQGDAIRWYPPFALCIALFATLYLAGGSPGARLASAAPLGLAMSTNLIAPLVILPLAIYRYGLERGWRPRFELGFWVLFALLAAPGFYTAASLLRHGPGRIEAATFHGGPLAAIAADVLGFFGGSAVGLGEAWALVPVAALLAVAMWMEIDRRDPANPCHLLLLMLAAAAPAALAGFAEPRAFLYLAPVAAAMLTVFLSRAASDARPVQALILTSVAVLPGIMAIAELRGGDHPFKRNAAIPYGEILDFIDRNKSGDTLVLSTDPVVPWKLDKRGDAGLCASYFFDNPACNAPEWQYGSVFVVSGFSNRSGNARAMQRFDVRVAEATAGRAKLAELHVGHDEDAMLKTRLTGVPLDEFILTVDLYR